MEMQRQIPYYDSQEHKMVFNDISEIPELMIANNIGIDIFPYEKIITPKNEIHNLKNGGKKI